MTSVLLIGYTTHAAALQVEIEVEGVPQSEEQMNIFVMDGIRYKSLEWAVAFLLVAKLLRLVLILEYAWLLPKFRAAHLMQAITIRAPCLCFLPLFGVRLVSTAVIVCTGGVVLEIVGKYLVALAITWIKGQNPKTVIISAQEIGHAIEKTVAFFILVARLVRCWIPPLHAVC